MHQRDTTEADPGQIGQLITMGRGARVLTAAAALGVFDALGDDRRDAQTVATAIHADPRATEILLDALVALGLARKDNGLYANTATGRRCLTSNGPASIASNLRYQELLAPAWAQLPEIVRTGNPTHSLDALLSERPDFTRQYIRGMADIARGPAQELAAQLDLSNVRHALDVGGGPAAYARALVERNPDIRVVLLDLEPTLRIAEQCLDGSPQADRIELRPGNYLSDEFGVENFDLVLMSHITHDEGDASNKKLFEKAYAALRPGGQVVVHDFILNAARTAPLFGALFSVHMLTYTRQGRSYSADEYRSWMTGCGFREPRRIEICPGRPNATLALVSVKP